MDEHPFVSLLTAVRDQDTMSGSMDVMMDRSAFLEGPSIWMVDGRLWLLVFRESWWAL